jgi:hypothetical protein
MRFVAVFIGGIVVGYTLHARKDQSIDQVATGMVSFMEKRTESLRSRINTSAN